MLLATELFRGWEGGTNMSLFQESQMDPDSRNLPSLQNGFGLSLWSQRKTNPKNEMTRYIPESRIFNR